MKEIVFLVAIILNGTGNGSWDRIYPMKDMEACLTSVKEAKTDVAKGGDAEQGIALFCTNGEED